MCVSDRRSFISVSHARPPYNGTSLRINLPAGPLDIQSTQLRQPARAVSRRLCRRKINRHDHVKLMPGGVLATFDPSIIITQA
jgi:hypothetical protein